MQQTYRIRTTSLAGVKVSATNKQRVGHSFAQSSAPKQRLQRLVVRAESAENDDDFEARIAALKRAKGETPYGEGKKKAEETEKKPTVNKPKKSYDYTGETLHFESGPHVGDVAVNVALGATLIWLPLTIAAVGRGAFVKYRFTDRRISTITTAPWKNEQLDAAYQEVKDVVCIGRGIGIWGDMVITLNDNSKIEMRALPQFRELKEYILQRRDELTGKKMASAAASTSGDNDSKKGFSA